jgi:hypothetical protein
MGLVILISKFLGLSIFVEHDPGAVTASIKCVDVSDFQAKGLVEGHVQEGRLGIGGQVVEVGNIRHGADDVWVVG